MTVLMNNNHQKVLPPRMADLVCWYSPEWATVVAGEVSSVPNLCDPLNILDETASADRPQYTTLAGQFGGRNIMQLSQAVDAHHLIGTADMSAIFGSAGGGYVDEPKYTLAGVFAENATSDGGEKLIEIEGSGANKVSLLRHNQGVRFNLNGTSTGGNDFNSCDLMFTAGAAESFVFTSRDDGGGESELYFWLGANQGVWDLDSEQDYNIHMGEVQNINSIKLGEDLYGDFGELLVFNGEFSDAEVAELQNYLRDKWGCT